MKGFCVCVGTHVMHGTSCWPEKGVHVFIYCTVCRPFKQPSLDLNVAVAHGLLHIIGKVHRCFVLVKKQWHMDLHALASHLQM